MTRLIIDGNSWLNQALLRGEDHDEGRRILDAATGKHIQVNGFQYGVDGFFEKFEQNLTQFDLAPRQGILVWDGKNAKARRRTFLPTYKEGRDKIAEVSEQLNLARERVTHMMLDLGVPVAQQDGLEGDDVIGYLCKTQRYERNIVSTVDGDLCVLCDDNTDVWRLGEMNKNPYGGFPHKYITLYKSLVGDTGDKIPGAKGFGDAKFVDLVRIFGFDGLDMLVELIQNDQLDKLAEDVADFPALQKIIDSKQMVATSWRCASLLVSEVNTKRRPLDLRAGLVKQWTGLSDYMRVPALQRFYGTKTLVTSGNYLQVRGRFQKQMADSPFVALDIETSDTEASEEWLACISAVNDKETKMIDVLGHELTGMGLTFGANTQHTIYMTVDHRDSDNVTVDQCREMCELIPQKLHTIIQNRQFEFSVLYRTWGQKWLENGWHGMVPNALDTKIGAAYTNENYPKGLKARSKLHLGYEQGSYDQTTTLHGAVGTLPIGGRRVKDSYEKVIKSAVHLDEEEKYGGGKGHELEPAITETWESRQYKMNELTAAQVFDYGCDDTICTAALHTFYQLTMYLEDTWRVYLEVEQLPEYLTSLAFVQGIPISLAKVREMEERDAATYDAAWVTLRSFLMQHGWSGTVCPEFTELTPAAVKEAAAILIDTEEVQYTTKKRKLDGLALDMRAQFPDNAYASLLASMTEQNNLDAVNKLVKDRFTGEPKINFQSPKQMQNLFYEVIGITPRILNKLTDNQRQDETFKSAFKKVRQDKEGKEVEFTVPEWTCLIAKASTDDDAVAWALAKDELTNDQRGVLTAYKGVRAVMTRRGLFYKPYKLLGHWRDGRIHPSLNQCEAVTLRYSASAPNVQQMPSRGEGEEFRETILPHDKDSVVVSLDFSGQELRDMAEWSGDENLTACYLGDSLLDPHSLTAVAAAPMLWKRKLSYVEFRAEYKSADEAVRKKAEDLRLDAKTVNFGTQYDLQAPGLAQKLMVEEGVAQDFIDAKDAAMPGIEIWKAEVREQAERDGFVTTRMGARRHLREALMSDNKWEAQKAGRQGPNFKIQGSGAEQTKLAMSSMWSRGLFAGGKYRARFYAPIHDEVVFSVHREDALSCIREVHECMTQPYGGKVIPIVSSISLGRSFGQQVSCGDEFDEAVIKAALAKAFAT